MHKEVIGDAALYLGDCMEILPTLDFDMVITDPPYGIGFKYGEAYQDAGGAEYARLIGALRGMPLALLQYPEEMMRDICPVLGAPREVMAWVYPSNLPRQFRLWGIWGADPDVAAAKQPAKNPECAKVLNPTVAGYDWREINLVKGNSAEKTAHPCQLPTACAEWIVTCMPGERVVDPFMGSGTVGVACMNLGRKFIGIEIEPKYFEIACERIRAAQAQGRLFG